MKSTTGCARLRRAALAAGLGLGLLLSSPLQAQFYPPNGPRSAALGGTYVASLDDATAVLGNPAAIYLQPAWDWRLAVEGGAGDTSGLVDTINELAETDWSLEGVLQDPQRLGRLLDLLESLEQPGAGVFGQGQAALLFSKTSFALTARRSAWAAVYPVIDRVHIEPGNDPETSILYNRSGLEYRGLQSSELGLTLAHSFFTPGFIVGISGRYLRGETYAFHQGLLELEGESSIGELLGDALEENSRSDSTWAADLGLLLLLPRGARLGVVGRNLNSPELPTSVKGESLRLEDHWRAGVAYPIAGGTYSFDIDLTESGIGIPGYGRREAALGVELGTSGSAFLPRFGISENLTGGQADVGPIYSAGFGLRMGTIVLDLALRYAGSEYYAFALDLGGLF